MNTYVKKNKYSNKLCNIYDFDAKLNTFKFSNKKYDIMKDFLYNELSELIDNTIYNNIYNLFNYSYYKTLDTIKYDFVNMYLEKFMER